MSDVINLDLSTAEALETNLVNKNRTFDLRVALSDLKVKKNKILDQMAYEVGDQEHSNRCMKLHNIDFKIKEIEDELNEEIE